MILEQFLNILGFTDTSLLFDTKSSYSLGAIDI